MKKQYVTMTINGREYRFSIGTGYGEVPPSETLSETLRKRFSSPARRNPAARARAAAAPF